MVPIKWSSMHYRKIQMAPVWRAVTTYKYWSMYQKFLLWCNIIENFKWEILPDWRAVTTYKSWRMYQKVLLWYNIIKKFKWELSPELIQLINLRVPMYQKFLLWYNIIENFNERFYLFEELLQLIKHVPETLTMM